MFETPTRGTARNPISASAATAYAVRLVARDAGAALIAGAVASGA
ncbi:MAG: hypothetical protein H6Q81_2414, partial [Deltaproteobacteria bacterium]|nr:hypothetical protein [Deltaproteobacteria bacterium]